ncbi:MAG: alpha/beta fold hydrolase, partial [Chloroflexi bacterium]
MPRPFTVGGLHAWEWPGDPPGGLLLHGIGNYGRYWDFFADAIASRLRLIAPDARGHGESAKPAEGYAPADFVADAVAVMDTSALERPILVGHSM